MSDNIPFEIQSEIMKWLPIKSLIQFRSVSKQWNSLITSSDFIADYHVSNTQPPEHILVSYLYQQSYEQKYVSFVDDDTFPINMFPLKVPDKLLNKKTILGSSHGLFCVYHVSRADSAAVVWNPTIRKSVDIDLNIVFEPYYENVIGFGVCPRTLDPKIVKVTCLFIDDVDEEKNWRVEVFTISSGVWRSPFCNNFPSESIKVTRSIEDIDGFLYFLAYEWIVFGHRFKKSYLIILFDLKTEEFTEIRFPNSLAYETDGELRLSKLQDSVFVFGLCFENVEVVCNVWMIENDVQRSVKKVFTINPQNAMLRYVLGFRKSGELLIEAKTGVEEEHDGLFVYDPYSKHMSYVEISTRMFDTFASSYMETLLLLDH